MARKVRTVLYDELHIAIRGRHDLSPDERHQVLRFIRDAEQHLTDTVLPNIIPDALADKVEIEITK